MLCLVAAFSGPKAARADSQAGREFWFAWPETADASANDPSYDLDAQVVILSVSGPVSVQVTGPGLATSVMASPTRHSKPPSTNSPRRRRLFAE